jgi:hypothetical protein
MLRRMSQPALSVLLGGGSGACGFAALGLALYASGPALAGATVFGVFGFAVGALCTVLTPLRQGLPVQRQADLPADALASMVRATLAQATAERGARTGSAADRQPAELAAATLALAGLPGPAGRAAPAAATATSVSVPAPAAAAPAPAPALSRPGRQFASSAFGA